MTTQRAAIQREAVPLFRQWNRAVLPFHLRPLLFCAIWAALGIALGGEFALWLGSGDPSRLQRFEIALWWPLPLLLGGALVAIGAKNSRFWRGVAGGLGIAALFAFYTGQRLAPPAGDVSGWARIEAVPNGALEARGVRVRGIVSDYVRRGEFGVQFPLRVSRVEEEEAHGALWVSAPPGFRGRVGDEISADVRLSPLDLPSNPGEQARFWAPIYLGCWARASALKNLRIEGEGAGFGVARRIETIRIAILRRYELLIRGEESGANRQNRPFAAPTAQLLTAMVWGEGGLTEPLPRQTRDNFRVAGLSHLLVASGTQVGIVCLGLGFLTRRLIPHRILGALILVAGVAFYALLAGGAPSIWRAALVGFFGIACLLLGRDLDWLSLWAGALLLLLALDPVLAWSLSLQLSFGATWGLIVLTPHLAKFLRRYLGDFASAMVAACLGAQWGVLPISLFHFGAWGALGVGANIVVVPLAVFLVIGGALSLLFTPLIGMLYHLTQFVAFVAQQTANLPGSSADSPPLKAAFVPLCYAILLACLWPVIPEWRELGRELKKLLQQWWLSSRNRFGGRFSTQSLVPNLWPLASILVLLSAILTWQRASAPPPQMRAWVLDVGQGYATLLVSPRGRAVLVDGGSADDRSDIGRGVLVPALQSLGISTLDALILTGRDSKSCAGLPTLMREVGVARVLDGTGLGLPRRPQNEALETLAQPFYSAVLGEARRQKIPVRALKNELKWQLDGMNLEFFAPRGNQAIGVRASYGQSAIFVAHNLTPNDEARLASRSNLRAAVLVSGQNAGEGAASLPFLRAVAPRAVAFSTARYNFDKTPATTTLKRFGLVGASVFRTDLNGATTIWCDSNACHARPLREIGD